MKRTLALIFCIFLAGCASKPSVKNLNLKSSLNYGGEELAKIMSALFLWFKKYFI